MMCTSYKQQPPTQTSNATLGSCICGVNKKQSFFGKVDVCFGVILLIILFIVMAFLRAAYVIPFVLLILIVLIILLSIIRLAKGHKLKCSFRWSSIVVLGSTGGFGLFGF
jgi:hypothetical protein